MTVQANCVTKKTPETLEVFPKETFTSLWSFSKVPRVLIYAWTVHVKFMIIYVSLILLTG